MKEKNKKPNVILITVDCLRPDHLGFMGYKKEISPNLDKFSKECFVFANAFAVGPNTPYSFPAILTGTYPLDYQGPRKMERPRVFISEHLRKKGFVTAAIHSNPRLSSFFGYNRGWDFFEDITPPLQISYTKSFKKALKKKASQLFNFFLFLFPQLFFRLKYWFFKPTIEGIKVEAGFINQIAKDFVYSQQEKNSSFFLWLHYMDVHGPYFPFEYYTGKRKDLSFEESVAKSLPAFFKSHSWFLLKRFIKKYLPRVIELYDEGIKYVDQEIGDFFAFLKKEGIFENTLVILTADHGEEFLEHGSGSHDNKLYNELLRVPLLIKLPSQKEQKIIRDYVSLIDIPLTICEILEIEKNPAFKGKNIFENKKEEFVFHQTGSPKNDKAPYADINLKNKYEIMLAAQNKQWKYIIDYNRKKEEVYNLAQDPKEKNNLALIGSGEKFSFLKNKIKEFIKNNPPLSLLK